MECFHILIHIILLFNQDDETVQRYKSHNTICNIFLVTLTKNDDKICPK